MGSGNRFTFSYNPEVWGIALFIVRFPFDVTINATFLCFTVSLGFGKAYDDQSHGITAKDQS